MVVDVRGVSNRPGRAGTAAQPVTRGARRAVSSVVGIRSNYFLRFKPEKPLQFIVIDMLMRPLCNLGRLIHGCYFSGLQRCVGGGKGLERRLFLQTFQEKPIMCQVSASWKRV